jgi:uncharacterized membrane protein
MGIFIVGLVVFFGVHAVSIVAPQWRDAQALLIYGYGAARQAPVVLYTPPAAFRHVALVLMLPVFPLLVATYLPGRIKILARHPMLLATKLWATAHLLANGTLVDVLLFGAFLIWAVADRISLKRRTPRAIPAAPARPYNDIIAIVIGLAIYALFVLRAHQWLVGVSPLPSLQ